MCKIYLTPGFLKPTVINFYGPSSGENIAQRNVFNKKKLIAIMQRSGACSDYEIAVQKQKINAILGGLKFKRGK